MISIIIPAHNEAAVIERCLQAFVPHSAPGELEVIVVCNGCTDRTADLARCFGPAVQVIETATPSKWQALNLAERAARGFPRFYLDADVVLPLPAIRRVAAVLLKGTCDGNEQALQPSHCDRCPVRGRAKAVLAAAPRLQVSLADRPWLIRAYYQIWTRLPYCANAMIGSGCYALSQPGRQRFRSFPNLISDDGFVRLLFRPGERVSLSCCEFVIFPPRRLADLLNIKTRSQFDNRELLGRYARLEHNDRRSYLSALRHIITAPRLWPCAIVYVCILGASRVRARLRLLRGSAPVWDRDNSSRDHPPVLPLATSHQPETEEL